MNNSSYPRYLLTMYARINRKTRSVKIKRTKRLSGLSSVWYKFDAPARL